MFTSTAQSWPPLALPSPRCDHVGRTFCVGVCCTSRCRHLPLCLSRPAQPDARRHSTNVRATARRPPVVLLAGVWCDFAECALHGSLHHPTSSLLLETGDARACVHRCVDESCAHRLLCERCVANHPRLSSHLHLCHDGCHTTQPHPYAQLNATQYYLCCVRTFCRALLLTLEAHLLVLTPSTHLRTPRNGGRTCSTNRHQHNIHR